MRATLTIAVLLMLAAIGGAGAAISLHLPMTVLFGALGVGIVALIIGLIASIVHSSRPKKKVTKSSKPTMPMAGRAPANAGASYPSLQYMPSMSHESATQMPVPHYRPSSTTMPPAINQTPTEPDLTTFQVVTPKSVAQPRVQRFKEIPERPVVPSFPLFGDDEDENTDALVRDYEDTLTQLKAIHPHPEYRVKAGPAVRDEDGSQAHGLDFTPFTDEADMEAVRQNSQVLHIPAADRSRTYQQSKNHGNRPKKKTNRGGGNTRRYA